MNKYTCVYLESIVFDFVEFVWISDDGDDIVLSGESFFNEADSSSTSSSKHSDNHDDRFTYSLCSNWRTWRVTNNCLLFVALSYLI